MIEAVFSLPDSSWESSDLTQLWEVEMTTPQVGGPYLRVTRLAAECRGSGSIRQIWPRQRSGQMACWKHLLGIRKTHSAFQTVKRNAGEGKIFPSCFRLLARSQGRQSSQCPWWHFQERPPLGVQPAPRGERVQNVPRPPLSPQFTRRVCLE